MSYQLPAITSGLDAKPIINASDFARLVQGLTHRDVVRRRRHWDYYRNPMLPASLRDEDASSSRPYRQAQEWGLPSRITGAVAGSATPADVSGMTRKEVVIENDIGWRIDTMVDYLFGKPIALSSNASDPARRAQIERLLHLILARHGGAVFLQQLALLGAVHGFVDVLVKLDQPAVEALRSFLSERTFIAPESSPELSPASGASDPSVPPVAEPAARCDDSTGDEPADDVQSAELARIAQCIRLEIVEPTRALPLLDPLDYRRVLAYAQVYAAPAGSRAKARPRSETRSWLERIFPRLTGVSAERSIGDQFSSGESEITVSVVELISSHHWQRYENESLVAQGTNSLGELPLVHIQNSSLPFEYPGASDVESLMALQDELNTRLSDRAHRITMQSFKMYLGKGIDNFGELPVAPGRMWMTENENAQVQEFGGDAQSPSEDSHIREIREAMDKTSSVTPIAAGAIKGRIGQLTSAAALRVTMMALLARTDRKRTLYGEGIKRMCALSLAWLDRAGLFHTTADERSVEISWPNALPIDDGDRLAHAHAKLRLGVPRDIVLRELGYSAG